MILYDQWAKFGLWTSLLWLVNIYILDCQKKHYSRFCWGSVSIFCHEILATGGFLSDFFYRRNLQKCQHPEHLNSVSPNFGTLARVQRSGHFSSLPPPRNLVSFPCVIVLWNDRLMGTRVVRFVVIKSCPKGFRKPVLERILVDKEFLGFSKKRRDVMSFFWQLTSDIYWGCPPSQ